MQRARREALEGSTSPGSLSGAFQLNSTDMSLAVDHLVPGVNKSPQPRPDVRRKDSIGRSLGEERATLVVGILAAIYAILFWRSLNGRWFHPGWTTDDAVQQIYPFYQILYPEVFKGDLITEVMTGYLGPLHKILGYGITLVTRSPIMAGHWIMLIQLSLTLTFLFLAVRSAAGRITGLFAAVWFLHTRLVVQRLTGGLPRGWAPPIFAVFIYCAFTGKHRTILALLFVSCLLHPPATVLCGFAYGLYLVWNSFTGSAQTLNRKHLLSLIVAGPIYAATLLLVIHRPEHIGQMVSYEQASLMPEFQRPDGRFPFLPLPSVLADIRLFGFEPFIGRLYRAPSFLRSYVPEIVFSLLVLIFGLSLAKRRQIIPMELWFFIVAALSVYFLSRALAFRLYVPNRHIQIPFAMFLISGMSIGFWRMGTQLAKERWWGGLVALGILGSIIYLTSGAGLSGTANFNYTLEQRGRVFQWLRENTPESALVAGQPTFMDPVELFSVRRGYVTTETTHPFYVEYNAEMQRRLEIVFRAHYARTLDELLRIIEPEGITHFVFDRRKFSPEGLLAEKYFPPVAALVKQLTARPAPNYAYFELPQKVDLKNYPFMPFRDERAVVIDVGALKTFLAAQGKA